MPYSKYRPELMGHVTMTPQGRFEVGSFQSFTLTYTAGRFGIDDLGGLQVVFMVNTDMSPLQFEDPLAPGYTTLESSNGAPLVHKWELRRNFRPFAKALYVQTKRFLDPGDTITVRIGDQRQGSPGVRMQTFCEDAFLFKVIVDAFGTQNYVELPAFPEIEVVSGLPVLWKAMLPTLRAAGAPFRLGLKAEDKWGNPSDRIDATVGLRSNLPVAGLPETVSFIPGQFTAVIEDLSVAAPGDLVIDVVAADGSLLARSNPLRVAATVALPHYWADLHGQSEETVGTNSARRYFAFARDKGFADACCHQGNDFQITPAFWQELNALTAEFDEPGRFVAVPGYEWSGNTSVGGDHNVLYRHEGRPIFRSSHALLDDHMADEPSDAHDVAELMTRLADEDVVVLAHVGGRYADVTYQRDGKFAHDGRIETAVEIHSAWGSFEWILNDAFACGFRVGVVANSDGHKGRPAASYPGAATFGSYGGLTCYLLPSLERAALFEALRRRHHYATTGDRLYLQTAVELAQPGALYLRDPAVAPGPSEPASRVIMGDILRSDADEALLSVDVLANAPIERLEIRDGLEVLETVRAYAETDLGDADLGLDMRGVDPQRAGCGFLQPDIEAAEAPGRDRLPGEAVGCGLLEAPLDVPKVDPCCCAGSGCRRTLRSRPS